MSVAPAPTNVRRVRQRACRPSLVTRIPSTAGNSRADDALCGRDADAAVLDWRNAITKTEPAPRETVIDQASSRRATLPWDGGILSNTPVEAVFDDYPRRNSLVFVVHL
jgi:hypothetical protein